MRTINEMTQAVVKERMRWVDEAQKSREKLLRGAPVLDAVLRVLQPHGVQAFMSCDSLVVAVPVKSMADAGPIIEAVQDAYGIEMDQERDWPEYGYREWKSTGLALIEVRATLPADDDDQARCRRVPAGQKVVTEYRIECDGPSEVRA